MEQHLYHLTGPDGNVYGSAKKGLLGGQNNHYHGEYYSPKNRNLYGRLDCPSALHALEQPSRESFVKHRVFFQNEDDAISAGFRPCHSCLREKYEAWKAGKDPRTAPFPPEYYEYVRKIEQEEQEIGIGE